MSTIASHRHILATAKGGGFLAGGTFFAFAIRFVIAILLARFLGAEDYGLYVLSISAAGIFAGVSLLGLDDAMVRYVAILSGRRDRAGVWGTLQIGVGVSAVGGLIMGGVLFVASGPIAEGLFDEPELAPLLRLLAVVVPFLTASNVLLGAARGFGRMDYAALAEKVVQSVVRLVLLGLLVLVARLNVFAAVVVFGLSDVAATITLIVLLNRLFPLKRSLHHDVRHDVRDIFGFAFPLWLSGLLRQFRRNIQNVLIGALSTISSVGIFAVVNRVNLVANVSSHSIYVAVRPLLAQLHDQGDREALAGLYTTTTRWTLTLNVPFFLVMVLYPKPLLLVFGKAFEAGASALIVLAFAQLANAATGICQPLLDMTGHTRVKLVNTVLWTVLLIGSSAVLIPRWDVVGAATASLIAVATVNIVCVVEVRALEGLLPFDRSFLKPIGAGVGALAAGLVLGRVMPVGAIGPVMLQALLISATYAGVLLLLGLAPEDRLVIDRVISKVRRSRALVRGRSV